jgi:hypothetical protein
MKRIIRHSGPRATDRALAMQKWREKYSDVDILTASPEVIKAMHDEMPPIDFHEHEYEDTINYALSKRSLDLLERLAEFGIYGESSAEVGARFVDQALKEFVEHNKEPQMPSEERDAIMSRTMTHEELMALQLPKIDYHNGEYEDTINDSLSTQSLFLLDRLAELEIYGETSAEVGARFVDQALKEFVARPRFAINRTK